MKSRFSCINAPDFSRGTEAGAVCERRSIWPGPSALVRVTCSIGKHLAESVLEGCWYSTMLSLHGSLFRKILRQLWVPLSLLGFHIKDLLIYFYKYIFILFFSSWYFLLIGVMSASRRAVVGSQVPGSLSAEDGCFLWLQNKIWIAPNVCIRSPCLFSLFL